MPGRKLVSIALLFALTGCATPITIRVVDIDNAFKPIAGATIERYPTPKRGEPWTTSAAEVQKTDADGRTTFSHASGRFLMTAPGKASSSFYSTFAPNTMEVGLSAPK